jgi:hypothetical protein
MKSRRRVREGGQKGKGFGTRLDCGEGALAAV